MSLLAETYRNLCQRLRQFGRLDAGRIFGSVPSDHGGYKAWMDLYERATFMRGEVNAISALLLRKGIVTEAEWMEQLTDELAYLFRRIAASWPEVDVPDDGHSFVIKDPEGFAKRSKLEEWPP